MSPFENKVKQIISELVNVEDHEVFPEANLQANLGVDSLDMVDLIMELEGYYNIQIVDEEMWTLNTVQDIYTLLDKKVTNEQPA